ncbi:MAG: isochorismatase family protein [Alphaproteobacteria bacterium]|nr:isochorismatase family protein [Alphaproteobacteria bacterium]
MRPKTLLQMAGASGAAPRLADFALIAIDCQREYVDGRLPLVGVEAALGEVAALLAAARNAGAPVLHVVHRGRAGGLFDPDGAGFAIADPAAARQGETIVAKGLPNAFAGTTLDATLKAAGRKDLLLAGFMTHMCIAATAKAAVDLGYNVAVVAAACATRDLPDPLSDAIVPAASLHTVTLAGLADRFALVLPDAAAMGNGR